jgi:hypothetical protein
MYSDRRFDIIRFNISHQQVSGVRFQVSAEMRKIFDALALKFESLNYQIKEFRGTGQPLNSELLSA